MPSDYPPPIPTLIPKFQYSNSNLATHVCSGGVHVCQWILNKYTQVKMYFITVTSCPHWFLVSLCSAMAVFLGTMLTTLVRTSKATPT